MVSFNVMDAIAFGYRQVWAERRYLLILAAIPLLLKIVCHMTVMALGWENLFMRQALVMLPSYFADGWMLAHFTRLVFLGQRWPAGDADKAMRARGILAGTLAFVIVEFLMAGITDVMYQFSLSSAALNQSMPMAASLLALMFITGFLWLFRYFWFYIPAAVNYPLPYFSRALKGYMTSLYMLAVWLACIVPGVMAYRLLLSSVFPSETGRAVDGFGVELVVAAAGGVTDTVIAFIATAAMAHAIRSMIEAFQKDH